MPNFDQFGLFLFSERNSFNLNQCALGHRICLLSHEVKYYLEWLHLSHNHLKALQYCKDLEYCLMRLSEDLSFGSDSYFPIGSVNSARDWPARHAWLVITERFELFLIPHIPEMYVCWCVSYCLSRKYKNHMQVTKYSSQQALYKGASRSQFCTMASHRQALYNNWGRRFFWLLISKNWFIRCSKINFLFS